MISNDTPNPHLHLPSPEEVFLGNTALLDKPLTAYLVSSLPDEEITGLLNAWVSTLNPLAHTVLLGCVNREERDAAYAVMMANVPLVVVTLEDLPKPSSALMPALNSGRLLMVNLRLLLDTAQTLDDTEAARLRNHYILSQCASTVVAYCKPGGKLHSHLAEALAKGFAKPLTFLMPQQFSSAGVLFSLDAHGQFQMCAPFGNPITVPSGAVPQLAADLAHINATWPLH